MLRTFQEYSVIQIVVMESKGVHANSVERFIKLVFSKPIEIVFFLSKFASSLILSIRMLLWIYFTHF